MNYQEVISLNEVKNYLRVDDDFTDDDNGIRRMVESSINVIEKWTNILLYDREKTYKLISGCVRVYDYPINSVTSPTEADMDNEEMTLYTNYSYGIDNSDLVLDVGYDTKADIPSDLIDVLLELVDLYYYAKETGKTTSNLSLLSIDTLNRHKRFII